MSYLLPARLADQKGLYPTLHLGPSTAHTQTHIDRHTLQSAATAVREMGSLPSTQGVVCGWQRQKLTRPPRACLLACLRLMPYLDEMAKKSSLKKPGHNIDAFWSQIFYPAVSFLVPGITLSHLAPHPLFLHPNPAHQPPLPLLEQEKKNVKAGRKGPVLRMCHPGGPLHSLPPTSTQWEPVPLLFVTLNEPTLLHILGGGN